MKNKLTKIFLSLAALLFVLSIADTANAQRRDGRAASKQQIEDLLKRIEERTDHFSNDLNKSLDRSRLDGSRAEDRITDRAKDLENATDVLRREFDFSDSRGETRANAGKVVREATIVNRIMVRRNFDQRTETAWIGLRAEINRLAQIYRLRTVGNRFYR